MTAPKRRVILFSHDRTQWNYANNGPGRLGQEQFMEMKCGNCNTPRQSETATFCSKCGTPFGYNPPPIQAIPHQQPGQMTFHCPYCQSNLPPIMKSKVSTAGWIVCCLLFLFTCILLAWVGLLIKDEYRVCASCGMKLG